MRSVRESLVGRFEPFVRKGEPDESIGDAVYALLRSDGELDMTVDGWLLFRVTHETRDSLEAVGLMTLLPSGSIPIAVRIGENANGLAWSMQVGEQDEEWRGLSDSKRWNNVYLFASGSTKEPPWAWGRRYQGVVR